MYKQLHESHSVTNTDNEIEQLIELTNKFIMKIKNQTYKNMHDSEMESLLHATDMFLLKIKIMQVIK